MNEYDVHMTVDGEFDTKRVKADYYVIVNGVLALRLNRVGNTYPEAVITVAEGHWSMIEKVAAS